MHIITPYTIGQCIRIAGNIGGHLIWWFGSKTRHLKILVEFKFGDGPSQDREANYALCVCAHSCPRNVLKYLKP